MLEKKPVSELAGIAKEIRLDCLEMGRHAGKAGAHFGGSFSAAEIFAVLYHHAMNVYPDDPKSPQRDRFILSKGHVALALYSALKTVGIMSKEDLETFKNDESILSVHPSMHVDKGIEFSTGSLGQGLSLGVGTALRLRMINNDARTFVLLGDGECDEGSVWEAAMSAAHFGLSNLVAIIDENQVQYDGPTAEIMNLGSLADKWSAFGWKVYEVDGHDVAALADAFDKIAADGSGKPSAVVAHTIKGKGASFMELDPAWHHNVMTDELYEQTLRELGEE